MSFYISNKLENREKKDKRNISLIYYKSDLKLIYVKQEGRHKTYVNKIY